jgi:hypothetical protein
MIAKAWRWVASLPAWVTAGAASGLLAGVAVGAMVPGPGIALGLAIGLGVGAAAGSAVHKDQRRREARDRELDDIIGVTSGSLGAPPGSLRRTEPPEAVAARAWMEEWLTPPPPAVR